jgi:chromosome segregation ATPase
MRFLQVQQELQALKASQEALLADKHTLHTRLEGLAAVHQDLEARLSETTADRDAAHVRLAQVQEERNGLLTKLQVLSSVC